MNAVVATVIVEALPATVCVIVEALPTTVCVEAVQVGASAGGVRLLVFVTVTV